MSDIPRRFFSLFLVSLFALLSPPLKGVELELIAKGLVDQKALTFAQGSATRFARTVNGRTHQQSPLVTSRGYQYVTYFNADRRLCVGRRKLPDGPWDVFAFEDHFFQSNDSHNAAVLGICEKDGTVHLAFDHHADQLNYRVSQLGVAHKPEQHPWEADLFGEVQHTLGSVTPAKRVTYPRFFPTPSGNLMLYYRAVTSANGDGMLEEYDGETHDWTPGLGKFIARDKGIYTADGRESRFRNPYMNPLGYTGTRLHASWTWRDRFERTQFQNHHDICYVYSDDDGRTWSNSEGKKIAVTGENPIHLDSPGLVVAAIPINSDLSSQNSQYVYPDGSVHIALFRHLEGTEKKSYHHHWRSPTGEWKSEVIPFSGARPKLVGDSQHNLYLIASGHRGELLIVRGIPNAERTSWTWSRLPLPAPHSIAGDALLDESRWENEGVLSIYGQEVPPEVIKTESGEAIDGLPSALTVTDYRIR